jgi:hypothetical protein
MTYALLFKKQGFIKEVKIVKKKGLLELNRDFLF